ncbi:hypothetical protein Ahy_A01g002979 isoform E [Arachis hypogaea]|uniref:Uncharacterized protein n=1 Tax=Arachis hypogaea TaxID=3818 RepID=A0A445ERX8_ARAHY|nr:hypothetical protein Ahy_A01g002979 isoform E [Arachis hypogaea]
MFWGFCKTATNKLVAPQILEVRKTPTNLLMGQFCNPIMRTSKDDVLNLLQDFLFQDLGNGVSEEVVIPKLSERCSRKHDIPIVRIQHNNNKKLKSTTFEDKYSVLGLRYKGIGIDSNKFEINPKYFEVILSHSLRFASMHTHLASMQSMQRLVASMQRCLHRCNLAENSNFSFKDTFASMQSVMHRCK